MPIPFDYFGKHISNCKYTDIPLVTNTLMTLNNIDPHRAMIPWAPSTVQTMPDLSHGAVVCGTNVVKGIAKALNMRLETNTKMTGDIDTDSSAKLHSTLELAKDFPYVILHIGGCDEASHRMDKSSKSTFLMEVD
jgi:2,3-bisphosphoglycerate-independent phosphoglycerate mutase